MAEQLLSARDKAVIWHPFTQMKTAIASIPIIKAKGVYLYSEQGKAYLDAISSWWVNLHGHAHPYIARKIASQMETLEHVIFADFTHEPAVELAERLLPLLPGSMGKIFYSDNGSTAVETALKMALQYWHNLNIPRKKVICFKNSYHGDTFGAMSAAGKNAFNRPFWSLLFEVEAIDAPLIGKEEASLSQLKAILQKNEAACFIFEPLILGAGGMIIYPQEGLNTLIQHCREQGVLIIADEVMTGFGRTGSLFASESPDLVCLSKGLTGGFLPLGATACTDTVFKAFLSDRYDQALLHGHSYTANPLACASALASLDLLLEEACTLKRRMIASSHQQFCEKWQGHPKLKRCESLGTILAVEYMAQERDRLYRFFLSKELLLRPLNNVVYAMTPYCIEEGELRRIYEALELTFEGIL